MKSVPTISDAEWRVMQVFWEAHPKTANDVVEQLADSTQWNPRTVKSLINRLVKKGALTFEKDGRTYKYSPAVVEEDCVRSEGRSFLKRVFGGALAPLLVHFIEDEQLSNEEIDELQKILDAKRRKNS
jgi:BlaI family penicillinase repressor